MNDLHSQATAFGQLLRYYRLAAGLSQEGLAERARMSAVAISALERGKRRSPYRHTVAVLSDALRLVHEERAHFDAAARASRPREANERDDSREQLPLFLTSLHARDRELEILERLVRQRRLVTLCGVGGVGKTRLAVETARRARSYFTGGIRFVDLATLVEIEEIVPRIAASLGLDRALAPATLEMLTHALRRRSVSLLLDNCEHLLDAVARIVHALLEECPQVRVIATSREALRVPGERIYRVLPLTTAAAAGLFQERAEDTGTALAVGERHTGARALAAICERLDGIPLAIELAAERASVLSLEALAAHLDDRFRLLTCGARTGHSRQRTLHATLAWSHALLACNERAAFRRLGIFTGGWTLEAAQHVCADGNAVEARDVLGLLATLTEKSLVVSDRARAEPRYRFLETVRAYALERLAESDECEWIAARHHAYVRTFGEPAQSMSAV